MFEYIAVDAGGQRVEGALAGASERAVVTELESRKLTPVRVSERREHRGVLRGLTRGVSARQVGSSYQQLADLLKAGVPLMRSLTLLSRMRSAPRLASAFRGLADEVSKGSDLADAMGERPAVFSKVHCAMVRAGERGGFLEQVFERLGEFVLKQAELRAKVVGNLVYPAFLVTLGAVILGVIFGFFVPKFRPEFERLDDLPFVTDVVLVLSDLATKYGVFVGLIVALAGGAVWWWARTPEGARAINVWQTRAPVIGPIVRALAAARFCRMLGTMEANGVPLIDALQIAKGAAGNVLLEDAIERATEAVRGGRSLAEPLGESGLFDEDVVEMIAVGESSGRIDEVLLRTAGTIESRIDRLLTVAIRLLEPVLLAIVAGVIGLVAAGLILPMVRLSEAV